VKEAPLNGPGLPLAGYEHGDDLKLALASGFTALAPLSIWLHHGQGEVAGHFRGDREHGTIGDQVESWG
jgi:hypothetical protein